MKIRAIVTVVTATLFVSGFASASFAQGSKVGAQDGIEVITITAKRLAPTATTACVNEAIAKTGTDTEYGADARRSSTISLRKDVLRKDILQKDIRNCIEQAATGTEAQS